MFQVTDGLSELKDVDRESVYEAGKELANAAVKVLAHGCTVPDREVCRSLLVVTHWPSLFLCGSLRCCYDIRC